jgi:hypothetical protein
MRRVRPTRGERASAGPPNDPGSPERGRGRRHRREAAAPDPGQWTPEPTEPGRKDRAARAACSGSVPRTPCPCGLSAVHAPVGQRTYLQPSWDERAPSRPTSQRPSSLPQSPRGFASSSSQSRSFRKRHTCIRLCTPSGAFRQPSALRTARRPVGCRHGWRTLVHGAAQNAALVRFRRTARANHTPCRSPLVDASRASSPFEHGCRAAHCRFRLTGRVAPAHDGLSLFHASEQPRSRPTCRRPRYRYRPLRERSDCRSRRPPWTNPGSGSDHSRARPKRCSSREAGAGRAAAGLLRS